MYIKIYFNDKPLFLCDSIDKDIEPYYHHDDAIFIDDLNNHTIKSMLHEMQQPNVHAGIFLHNNFEELKKEFFKKFTIIKAGGGLVVNKKNEMLMIYRRNKWDLPKGKLDEGEDIPTCAIREVKEETGLKNINLENFLTLTYHTYYEGTKHILKETHWFVMHSLSEEKLIPQAEEQITEIKWAAEKDFTIYLQNSFALIYDVIKEAKKSGSL